MTTPIRFEPYLCIRNDTIDNTIYELACLIYGKTTSDSILRNRALSIVTAMAANPDSAKPNDGLLNAIIAKATKIINDIREDIVPKDDESPNPEWDMRCIGEIADYVEDLINSCGIPACRPYYEGDEEAGEYDEGEGVNKNAGVPCYLGHDCKVADCPVRKAWGIEIPKCESSAKVDIGKEELDDFQRQLKRFDIKVRGKSDDMMEQLFRIAVSVVPKSNEIRVETHAGTLLARPCTDPDYPGIDIVLVDKDGAETNLALVEHITGGESYTGENHVIGDNHKEDAE